jgi:hypothetical protein
LRNRFPVGDPALRASGERSPAGSYMARHPGAQHEEALEQIERLFI